MSTSSTSPENWQPAWASWSHLAPYMVPPAAAASAVIPVYYGFEVKSAQQLGLPIPKMSFWEVIKGGFKAAPTIGMIVGTQMVAQNLVEKTLHDKSKPNTPPSFSMMLASSAIVAGVSAPLLAVFNGQTMARNDQEMSRHDKSISRQNQIAARKAWESMAQNAWETLRKLTLRQSGAIVVQETSFLFSARVTGPLNDALKDHFGDTTAVRYGSPFLSGMIGAFCNHPANTALTLWQKNQKVVSLKQLMQGSPVRAVTVGGFMVCYQVANDILKPKV